MLCVVSSSPYWVALVLGWLVITFLHIRNIYLAFGCKSANMKHSIIRLLLFIPLVTVSLCQNHHQPFSPTVKLRNVDDPNKDSFEYSRQWAKILQRVESDVFNQAGFGNTFRSLVQSKRSQLNVSTACIRALSYYFERPLEQQWSLQMWDSNGHIPSGIFAGTFFDAGNYDQCMEIPPGEPYGSGKYCILELRVPAPIRMVNFTGIKYAPLEFDVNYLTSWDNFSGIANGLCLPAVCADDELAQFIPDMMPRWVRDSDFRIQTRLCQVPKNTNEPILYSMDFAQKLSVVIIGISVTLVLLGTLLEMLALGNKNFVFSVLQCFSCWTNSRILFHISKSTKSSSDQVSGGQQHIRQQFKFIHGLRVFSIYWVVYAHVFLFHPYLELYNRVSPVQSLNHRQSIANNLLVHFIANGGLAVGTFFIISGALTIYTVLPAFKRKPINIFSFVMLRWIRFAPPSLGMICFLLIWPLFGSGPLFHPQFTSLVTSACYTHWWANFLFVTNMLPSTKMCNVMTWYLGADFQLHILLYFVVYFFYRHRRLVQLYIGTMFVLGFVWPIAIVVLGINDALNPSIFLHPTHKFPMERVVTFIFGTYNHFIPYFTGVILGLMLIRKRPLQISSITSWILWCTIFPLAMLLPFASYSFVDSTEPVEQPLPSAIMFGLVRLIWAGGMLWLCYECASGRATLIRRILSADFLQPLSRLTFAIFLVHIIPVWHYNFSIRNPVPINMESFLFIGTANCVYATVLAYLLYLLFEAPYVNLIKLLVMPAINGAVDNSKKNRSSSMGDQFKNNNNNITLSEEENGAKGDTSTCMAYMHDGGQSQQTGNSQV